MSTKSEFSPFAEAIRLQKYAHEIGGGRKESWQETSERVATHVLKAVDAKHSLIRDVQKLIEDRKFIPGGRYLYAAGKPIHQVNNCLLMSVEDSRIGWADLLHKSCMALMTGAGVGIWYSKIRPAGSLVRRMGGTSTGPISVMQMVNECGRHIMQGGSRRSALWAGLSWDHPDIEKFITIKDWPDYIKEAKARDYNAYAVLDGTNISVGLNTDFFEAYTHSNHTKHELAHRVYWATVKSMLRTGEPGFSIDTGVNEGENLRNACTEICSADDSDTCNLGSINLARIESAAQMESVVELATVFLLAGTVYSDLPYKKVYDIRQKNRRLGLGLMGMHEFLLRRGVGYGPCDDLVPYLKAYTHSTKYAAYYAHKFNLSTPVKTRAIAPTGTIGILAETSTGIEPVFCVAYKRRYLDGLTWKYQYVVDPVAQALIEQGIKPDAIEDAYSLSKDVERRMAFQAWVQQYVDHGISSTINLPQWGSALNNEDRIDTFGNTLMRYLPAVRGITVFPDGARAGQPLNSVSYQTAMKHRGEVFYEQADLCDLRGGGTCGS